jgi:N-acetylmuramoyl-L-alanine amidase
MMHIKFLLLLMIFCGFTNQTFANEQQKTIKSAEIRSLLFSQTPDYSRLVLDANNTIDYKVFTLKEPHRLVIDIASINKKPLLSNIDFKNSPITNIRTAIRNSTDLRVVLYLK